MLLSDTSVEFHALRAVLKLLKADVMFLVLHEQAINEFFQRYNVDSVNYSLIKLTGINVIDHLAGVVDSYLLSVICYRGAWR